ncbi:MAG: GNAT family N-acetyltransferase [Campylobacterota bacterium]|nr:GNAT family N-acetyltransferase [Campylobacterota bacterium]
MQSVQLDKKRHERKGFDCGVEALNNYLKLMANQQSSKDNSRTYVLEDSTDRNKIIGFYTLTMTSIDFKVLPSHLEKKHQNSNSAGLIARLAVDKRYAKQGYGAWLLIDAIKKLLEASEIVGFPIIVVDAKEGASDFYKQFGFVSFLDEENRLFITVADIKSSLEI